MDPGVIVLIALVALALWAWIAVEFNNIAKMKGYEGSRYFWWSFIFPGIGYLMVVALPDRKQSVVVSTHVETTDKREIEDDLSSLPEL